MYSIMHLQSFDTDDVLRAVKHIKTENAFHTKPVDKAGFVFGGQPGSGKSNLSRWLQNSGRPLFEINGDHYRKHHPCFNSISNWAPDQMPELTQAFANAVCQELKKQCLMQGVAFSVEGTCRKSDIPYHTAVQMKTYGYRTELHIMAAKPIISSTSTIKRYWEMLQAGLVPRGIEANFHDQAVMALPGVVQELHSSGAFHNIFIFDRSGEVLYEQSRSPFVDPGTILFQYQHSPLTKEEQVELCHMQTRIEALSKGRVSKTIKYNEPER